MGAFEQFPYTNFHELNLDWIINKVNHFQNSLNNINGQITEIVQEYLASVEMNAMYVANTETIILKFEEESGNG